MFNVQTRGGHDSPNEMKQTFAVINQMCDAGVIGKYAIGGAIGATFYLEPTSTLDIDIFVSFPESRAGSLLSLGPIYDFLTARGYKPEREHIVIEGWPVQFLPAEDALYKEALRAAVATEVEGVRVWVMKAEHLMAIALKTGRGKDFVRLAQFVEDKAYDARSFKTILKKHGLLENWKRFEQRYPGTQ